MTTPVYLASRVAAHVRDPRWAGALHRDHLQELLGCDRRTLNAAVAIACNRHAVDVCWGWVVLPLPVPVQRAA